MNKAWKWILGIILVLVVVAALVAVPFVMRNYMAANISFRASQQTAPGVNPQTPGTNPQAPGPNRGPMMRGFGGQRQWFGGFDDRRGPMMGGGRGFGFPRFGGYAPFGFGFIFLGGFLHLLVPLVLLGLLIFGVYQLGKRAGVRSTLSPAPVSTQPAPPAAASEANEEKPTE
jgi:hypothetical protein